ncbi:MAG TPA: PKD domain-containing protein [Gemmatimonadaceae bacterium]|jgi:probable HAF family extracellular repeat protein|nr:PKD domain-containing protein [Gemmatimonadaceae bacterium]
MTQPRVSSRTSLSHGRATRSVARVVIVAAASLVALACSEPIAPNASAPRIVPSSALPTLTGGSGTQIFPFDPNAVSQVRGDARALNDAGQVTGAALNLPPTTDDGRPYRWTPGSGAVQLGQLCCGTAWGADINSSGVVVGEAQISFNSGNRAFRATGTTMVKLDTLTGSSVDESSGAVAINASGVVAGYSASPTFNAPHAVIWNAANVIHDLGTLGGSRSRAIDINDAEQVIGTSTLPSDQTTHFFLWTAGTGMQDLTTVLGNNVVSIVAINNSGQIAGHYSINGQTHAFLYTPGSGVRDLGTLGGNFSLASGLNDNGQVVGSSQDANGITHAFLWTPSDGMEDVTGVTGVNDIRKLNNHLQTLTGSANYGQDFHAPVIVQLTITSSNQAPVASFSVSCPALQCTFDASGSTDDAGIAKYTWSWGTGKSESHAFPVSKHTYASAGSYSVTLTVTDAQGLTNSVTKSVQVPTPPPNQPPTVTISAPADGATYAQGQSVTFTASATDPEDGTLSGASLVWYSNIDGQIGTGSSFSTTALSQANHLITVTATDAQGAQSGAVVHVSITAPLPPGNQPPLASISYRCTAQARPHQCSFDGSFSSDDAGIVAYTWDWGNGRSETHAGPTARNTWASAGTYAVTLTVKDGGGLTNSQTVNVQVP